MLKCLPPTHTYTHSHSLTCRPMKRRPQSTANRKGGRQLGGSWLEQGEVAYGWSTCGGEWWLATWYVSRFNNYGNGTRKWSFRLDVPLHVEDLGGNPVSTWGQRTPNFDWSTTSLHLSVSGSRRPAPPCSCISSVWRWSCRRNRALKWRAAWWGRSTASVRSRGSSGAPGNNEKNLQCVTNPPYPLSIIRKSSN